MLPSTKNLPMSTSLTLTGSLSTSPTLSWPHLSSVQLSSLSPLLLKGATPLVHNAIALLWDFLENLRILFLFTKSDFKTILLPVTVFACIMAPMDRLDHLPRVVFWIWINLLQFCISNQCINPQEDFVNKPWRPIPAGRITREQSEVLQKFIALLALMTSYCWGVLPAGVLISISTAAYNDFGFHRDMVLRNVCNAVGYASFELGATRLAGNGSLNSNARFALTVSAMIVFTTIHAADFRDEKGDKLEGKTTLPIAFPEASRTGIMMLLVWWSSFLSLFWNSGFFTTSVLSILGTAVGIRFFSQRNITADRRSYLLYNIWLTLAHLCLGMGEFQARKISFLRHPMLNFH